MKLILKIIEISVFVTRLLFRFRTLCLWQSFKRHFYSQWVSREFADCGKNCKFDVFDFLRGADKMSFGDNVIVGMHSSLEVYDQFGNERFDAHLTVGNNSHIGMYGHISCTNKVFLGDNVVLGRRVFITDNSHGRSTIEHMNIHPSFRPIYSRGPVILEDNVWVGEGVCIMPGVTIGKGSVIGANAVVTNDIPPYSVAVGVPAKVVKTVDADNR